MSDVTCKAAQTFLDAASSRGIDPRRIAQQTKYSLEFLRNSNNRITWAEFVEIGRTTRQVCNFSDDDLEHVGRGAFKSGPLRVVMSVGRVLGDPARFYKWMQRGNAMLFANMTSSVEVAGPSRVRIRIRLRPGDEMSREYLLVSKGAIASMPTLLGYPEAKVALSIASNEAVFDVDMLRKRRSFMRRAFQAFGAIQETADELLATNEELTRRLRELSSANERIQAQSSLLEQQARRLRLANEIGQLIHGVFAVQETVTTIAATLLSNTSATTVSLRIVIGSENVEATVGAGSAPYMLESAIDARGATVGQLVLGTSTHPDRDELAGSLEYMLPVLGMAIDHALTYHELERLKRGLEQQVDQRTAELRQARDELAGTVDQLREAHGARERFFANISHEIRTPLSLILLAVSDISARAGALLDARASASLASVADAAHNLVRLVDELLLLAAGQEGKLRIAPEPTDVVALVAHLIAAWRPAAEIAGLELSARVPASLVAMVDPVALERIATNLVSNAVKYTPRGGTIVVEVSDDNELRLSVLDTGPGIGDELASRLFGRFERAAGEDRRKIGSGLGLSLVKQLVEAHGGTVSAIRRVPGPGSELRVSLPRIAVDANVAPVTPQRSELAERTSAPVIESGERLAPAELSAGTILLAEDDARLAEMVARLLSDDYTVVVALDGEEAVRLVRQHQPQLLITDVDMPGLDGISLAKQFREITNDALAPIIILSAVLDRGTRLAGLEAGAVDYITKPFDPAELRARVKAQFRMRDLALRLHRAEQLSALGILTSGLAHELRNPANGIVNAVAPLTKLLPRELTGPETAVGQLLEVMESCANQIGFLTRQLLSIRPGGTQLELQPAEMPELVDRAVALAHRALAGVEVRADLKVDQAVLCAPPLMVQVLVNLIENAGHAAGKGGWVEIDGRAGGGRVTVEIADSGPGVPIELRDRVFEPFFTTKPPGAGSGLGLPLARAIVLRHGGVLEIRERGAKPVFVMELPHSPHGSAPGAV
jgi:signal transduction histidine kinase